MIEVQKGCEKMVTTKYNYKGLINGKMVIEQTKQLFLPF